MLKILLAVDGSALSLDAVRHGLALHAQGLRAQFVLVNVQESASLYEMVVARDPAVIDDVSVEAGRHQLEVARALCVGAKVNFEAEVVIGDPAHLIVELAERHACDAIILGARGHGGLRDALLGSVSQAVTYSATVPVTVVKHMETDEPALASGESDPDEGA
jgi:nucleotide-binding universal stress UspA family protein